MIRFTGDGERGRPVRRLRAWDLNGFEAWAGWTAESAVAAAVRETLAAREDVVDDERGVVELDPATAVVTYDGRAGTTVGAILATLGGPGLVCTADVDGRWHADASDLVEGRMASWLVDRGVPMFGPVTCSELLLVADQIPSDAPESVLDFRSHLIFAARMAARYNAASLAALGRLVEKRRGERAPL